MIESGDEAINWTTFTYFYRRLLANPSYYSPTDPTHEGLGAYLSEMVETTLKELGESKVIEFDEDEGTVAPQNAAMIAAYYNISYITMQTFILSLTQRTKPKGHPRNRNLGDRVRVHPNPAPRRRKFFDAYTTACPSKCPSQRTIRLTSRPLFSSKPTSLRMQLPVDLAKDQEVIVAKTLSLLSATVDILSS